MRDAGRHVRNRDAVFGRPEGAPGSLLNAILKLTRYVAFLLRECAGGGEGRAAIALSRALRADRSLEKHGGDKAAMLAAGKDSFANLM